MIRTLEHVNLLVDDIGSTLDFYERVLGLRRGPVPGDTQIGDRAWLHTPSGQAILHIGTAGAPMAGSGFATSVNLDGGTGKIDHLALECEDYEGLRERLERLEVDAKYRDIPVANIRQIFVIDPDGVCLELNFRS